MPTAAWTTMLELWFKGLALQGLLLSVWLSLGGARQEQTCSSQPPALGWSNPSWLHLKWPPWPCQWAKGFFWCLRMLDETHRKWLWFCCCCWFFCEFWEHGWRDDSKAKQLIGWLVASGWDQSCTSPALGAKPALCLGTPQRCPGSGIERSNLSHRWLEKGRVLEGGTENHWFCRTGLPRAGHDLQKCSGLQVCLRVGGSS